MIRNRITLGDQRDCRKHNSSARKEIHGIMFQSRPRRGFTGNWTTDNGRVVIRKKHMRDPWSVYLDEEAIGNNEMRNFADCVHANEWAIKRGLT